MTVPGNIDALLLGGQRGYQIERSLRFNSADSAYLNRTPASAGNRKTWTWSGWVKRSKLGDENKTFTAGSSGTITYLQFQDNVTDGLTFARYTGTHTFRLSTTQVFRDSSAWYHITLAVDTTQATDTNRVKIYVNGTQITVFTTATYPAQNLDLEINNTNDHRIGGGTGNFSGSGYLDGYLTEINFIDGQALTPSSFGETDTITGVWKPKRYTGTYGTNGFYLKFADNSGTTSTTLGKDSSGNGNNWTPNNFSVTAGAGNDSMIDTPTPYADGGNGRGNYCTLNPLSSSSVATLSNGNLDVNTGTTGGGLTLGTFAMPQSGKWYWEVTPTSIGSAACRIGIANTLRDTNVEYYNDGTKVVNGASTSYGASYTDNDVIGIACDIGGNTVTFYKNNSSQGSISFSSWSTVTVFPMIADGSGSLGVTAIFNFGQRPFSYTVPAGFSALNTQNLPEPSIKKPSSYMDTLLYTGNGSARSITGLGFSPDLVWIKERSGADNHRLVDAVRGATKELYSSLTNAEGTDANGLTAFNSDGFSLGTSNSYNENGVTHVAWCWDESATPGFDIVTYTGNGGTQNISHNLGVAPKWIVIKARNSAQRWTVYHASIPNSYIYLNETFAEQTGNANLRFGNNTSVVQPTSSVFTIGNSVDVNNNTTDYVAYLWSEVAGFSKFGSYTGNGSTDGPFVFCNFRPRWVLIKSSSVSGESWILEDSARDTYNPAAKWLYPNYSDAESNGLTIDFLSNGFKPRISGTSVNTSSATYIFAAFAESPQKYSLAR